MSVEHVSDDTLQRHFDGELEPNERAEASAHIGSCDSCTARLRVLARLQELIRGAAQDAAADVNWQGMYERIEQATRIPAPAPAPAITSKPATATARARWFRGAGMSAAGAIAIAAAALLMVYRADPDPGDGGLPDDGDLGLAGRSEIVHVDFGENAGTVFDIAFADGSSTPVVWINDDEDDDTAEVIEE